MTATLPLLFFSLSYPSTPPPPHTLLFCSPFHPLRKSITVKRSGFPSCSFNGNKLWLASLRESWPLLLGDKELSGTGDAVTLGSPPIRAVQAMTTQPTGHTEHHRTRHISAQYFYFLFISRILCFHVRIFLYQRLFLWFFCITVLFFCFYWKAQHIISAYNESMEDNMLNQPHYYRDKTAFYGNSN